MWFKNLCCQTAKTVERLINTLTSKSKLQAWDKDPQVLEPQTSVGKSTCTSVRGLYPQARVNAGGHMSVTSNFETVQRHSGAKPASSTSWTVNSRLNWEVLPQWAVERNQGRKTPTLLASLGSPEEWPYPCTRTHTHADMNTDTTNTEEQKRILKSYLYGGPGEMTSGQGITLSWEERQTPLKN